MEPRGGQELSQRIITAGAIGLGSVCGIGSALAASGSWGVAAAIAVGIVCGTIGGVAGAVASGALVRLLRG